MSTFVAGNAINGNHVGGGHWADDTSNAYPDWIRVDFAGTKTISEIDVYGLQQNYQNPVEPTPTMTSTYALTNFEVQYWNGNDWATVPGGSVSGNNKVWRKFTFAALTTSKIRVYVSNVAGDNRSQVVEIEAYAAIGPSIQWLVSDHLGTPRIVVDQTGAWSNVSRHDYLPFDEELFAGTGGRTTTQGYSVGDGVRQQFTQKERDVETGLDYFIHRYRSSIQGRFTSADEPFVDQSEGDPQSWNLYTYAGNNPLIYTDPSGLWKWAGTDDNGNRLIQWEKGDDWYTLSEFLYKETGRDYLPRDLERAYSSGGLGPDTILDFSGAPSHYFTNNRGGLVDKSWDFYMTVLPAARGLKAAGGLLRGAWRGVAGLFAKESAGAGAKGVLSGSLAGLTQAERSMVQELLAAGKNVQIIPRATGKTADFVIDGAVTELKTLTVAGPNTLKNAVEAASKHGEHILVDARNVGIGPQDALQQVLRAQGNIGGLQGRVTVLTRGGTATY